MVNEKAKNPSILTPDGPRRSSSLESNNQRGKKRSLTSMVNSSRGLLNQLAGTREEVNATRLLTKHSTSKLTSANRQSESARLMSLIPDLSQKEMSRLVGAIIKRKNRDASSVGRGQATTLERSVQSTVHSLFPIKTPDTNRNQTHKVEMPARSAASTKEEALQMLRESRTETGWTIHPDNELHRHLDLAEELVTRASPRLACNIFLY